MALLINTNLQARTLQLNISVRIYQWTDPPLINNSGKAPVYTTLPPKGTTNPADPISKLHFETESRLYN